MKHAGQGALALLTLALASFPTLAQDQPEQKPGFFRQLGDSLKDAGQRMVGAKPRTGTRAQTGPSIRRSAAPAASMGSSRARTTRLHRWASWTGRVSP